MPKIIVIHGPNLNLLGTREPDIYGLSTLADIDAMIQELADPQGVEAVSFQSNSEGEIIDIIHREGQDADCLILNPAAYTHYSIAIADAITAVGIPAIEVHLSNIFAREEFRHHSVISPVVRGQVSGFGSFSYRLAVLAALDIIESEKKTQKKYTEKNKKK